MIGCAVLGATGLVGQRFIQRLAGHPMFQLRAVAGSPERAGTPYGSVAWHLPGECPQSVAAMPLVDPAALHDREDVRVVFSALPSAHTAIERTLADAGFAVFTNASTHRMDDDVPLLIPEVNPADLDIVEGQSGFLVANGNCSGIIVTLPLAAMLPLGLDEAHIVTQQALSGAGHGGVPEEAIRDNLLPYIEGEEEKLEAEPCKTLGRPLRIHATCTRVPVSDGHFATMHVHLADAPSLQEVRDALADFRGPADVQVLPSAPQRPIHLFEQPDRPQPRLDRDLEGGMAVSVGRLRDLGGGWFRVCVLGHNTVRGAAGQSILNAEFAVARGLLD